MDTNAIPEHTVDNVGWQRVDVAHADESIRVCLEFRIDTVASTEPLGFGQLVWEPKCDIDI